MTDNEWWIQVLRHFFNWKSFFIRAKLRPWRATSTSVPRTRPSSLLRRLWKKSSLPWVSTSRADYPSPKEAFLKTGKENASLGHWNSTSQLDFLSLRSKTHLWSIFWQCLHYSTPLIDLFLNLNLWLEGSNLRCLGKQNLIWHFNVNAI